MYKKWKAMPLPPQALQLKGISARTMTEHYKLYEGYVNKINETRDKLQSIDTSKGNATYSEVRALKRGESYALDGAKLHELYFEQLTGANAGPSKELMKSFEATYGSFDKWKNEFIGSGLSARGWAILAYDKDQQELFIYITDDQHNGHVIQSIPILPMDVFEHAYYLDYGTKRREHIDAFFNNLDWSVINKRFTRALKEAGPKFRLF